MTTRHRRAGFTLVELLVVITILGILVALLVPVIFAAINTTKNAQVSAEITTLGQSLASFKNVYGDFPPSRIVLNEDGSYANKSGSYFTIGAPIPIDGGTIPDLNYNALAARSVRYLRKFFPRASFSNAANQRHDFNGDGVITNAPILLEGHEALVFFLGGIPIRDNQRVIGMSGFSKDPTNPFVAENLLTGEGSRGRNAPFFEFRADRLVDEDGDGMPCYIDTLGTSTDSRYFAYFSSYAGTGYDPNDVNLVAADLANEIPLQGREFSLAFPMTLNVVTGFPRNTISPSPNPYTSSLSVPATAGQPATFINDQSYQIISAGRDRQFGVGGLYAPSDNSERLGQDGAGVDAGTRKNERDNLSNFSQGTLE